MRGAWVLVAAPAVAGLVGCGGGSTAATSPKEAWTAKHGAALATLHTDLETARTTLSSLQRPDILGSCNQLRDSLVEARKGLPVPDPTSDTNLRAGLDAVGVGTEDCIKGAQGPNIPQLEKSFSELREASTLMEVASRTIDGWR
ncbi:MAG: hypothetical protein M3066_14730 [Actinomycetota bacterium]|nr:hypothetical protein [Actinomycetota bacterium]